MGRGGASEEEQQATRRGLTRGAASLAMFLGRQRGWVVRMLRREVSFPKQGALRRAQEGVEKEEVGAGAAHCAQTTRRLGFGVSGLGRDMVQGEGPLGTMSGG